MFRLTTKSPTTRELVRADHRLLSSRPRHPLLLALLLALSVIAGLLYLRFDDGAAYARQRAELVAQQQMLKDTREQQRLERQEAEATQEQLLGRIAQLSVQVEQLQTDLAFFRQQKKAR